MKKKYFMNTNKKKFFSPELDRERARYEATVHLGNASSQLANDIRNERRRIMEYLPVFLEKQVSKNNNFPFYKEKYTILLHSTCPYILRSVYAVRIL